MPVGTATTHGRWPSIRTTPTAGTSPRARGQRYAHRPGLAHAAIYRWRAQGPWEALAGGLPQPLESMPYALLALPGRLFAGLADGRVYVSENGGDSWTELGIRGDRVDRIVALVAVGAG